MIKLSALILFTAFSINSFAEATCSENVTNMVEKALEQGEAYEKSGTPDIQPAGAEELDKLYYANFLDSDRIYPEDKVKAGHRQEFLNIVIFEAIKQGRSIGAGQGSDLTLLNKHKSQLLEDCDE